MISPITAETPLDDKYPVETLCILDSLTDTDISADVPLWHMRLQRTHQLHPTVKLMLRYPAIDTRAMLMQWPHISVTDVTRLAYTLNRSHVVDERQTITSIGKYLSRHWPHVPDHIRRDLCALYTPDQMYFVHTTPDMIMAVELGPRSCMASDSPYATHMFESSDRVNMQQWIEDDHQPQPDWHKHPYASYSPEFGWHMALRKAGNQINARALCLNKVFVRSYTRLEKSTDPSPSDTALESWLTQQKYTKRSSWPDGAKLAPFALHPGPLNRAPYLDGDRRKISFESKGIYIIDNDGPYSCTETDGTVAKDDGHDDDDDDNDNDDMTYCDCCSAMFYPEDMTIVGPSSDGPTICPECLRCDYQLVFGVNENRYYVHTDDAELCHGTNIYIDPQRPPIYATQLFSGEWAHMDDTTMINSEYYLTDSHDLVHLASGEIELRANAVCINDEWYLEDDPDIVEIDGIYHLCQTTLEIV